MDEKDNEIAHFSIVAGTAKGEELWRELAQINNSPGTGSQPPSSGGDGNQNDTRCTVIASVYRTTHRNDSERMLGSDVFLDDGRFGGEATGFPAFL
jgi:hypothetical protein